MDGTITLIKYIPPLFASRVYRMYLEHGILEWMLPVILEQSARYAEQWDKVVGNVVDR